MKSLLKHKSNLFLALAMLLLAVLPTACRNTSSTSVKTDAAVAEQNKAVLPEVPSTPVLDNAGLFAEADVQAIVKKCDELNEKNLAQVAVLTVNDLQGLPIEDYAKQVANKWGVGHKETNDGITFVIKPKTESSEGQLRIATGLGMEKILTDDMCKQIIDETMVPMLKENRYGDAVTNALDRIKTILTTTAQ